MSENVVMIKCGNCGASFASNEKYCPYCGAENTAYTELEYQKKVEATHEEIARELSKPQRFVAAVRKYLLFIIIAIVAVIGIIFACYAYFKVTDEPTYEVSTEYIDELEAAVAAKDYDKVLDYVYNKQLFSGKYEAYANLAEVYDEYISVVENEEKALNDANPDTYFMTEDTREMVVAINASYAIEYSLRTIWFADDILAKNTAYGTEDNIAELRDMAYEKLYHWELDDATINELIDDLKENGSSIADDDSLISKCGEKAASIILSEVK